MRSGCVAGKSNKLMSAIGLGCVKTQKSQNRRELFFSDQAKANTLKNSGRYNCDPEKRSFYRRRAPLRFYTAKTLKRHARLWIAAVQTDLWPLFRQSRFPDLIGCVTAYIGVVLSLGEGNATTRFYPRRHSHRVADRGACPAGDSGDRISRWRFAQ